MLLWEWGCWLGNSQRTLSYQLAGNSSKRINGQSALCESNLPSIPKKAGDGAGLEQWVGKDERDLSEVISLHSPFYEFILVLEQMDINNSNH